MTRHFEYLRPESVEAAIDMKVEHGSRGRFWAGGTDMMLLWQRRAVDFDYCIDLKLSAHCSRRNGEAYEYKADSNDCNSRGQSLSRVPVSGLNTTSNRYGYPGEVARL
jgi:hypothetical protein